MKIYYEEIDSLWVNSNFLAYNIIIGYIYWASVKSKTLCKVVSLILITYLWMENYNNPYFVDWKKGRHKQVNKLKK